MEQVSMALFVQKSNRVSLSQQRILEYLLIQDTIIEIKKYNKVQMLKN